MLLLHQEVFGPRCEAPRIKVCSTESRCEAACIEVHNTEMFFSMWGKAQTWLGQLLVTYQGDPKLEWKNMGEKNSIYFP